MMVEKIRELNNKIKVKPLLFLFALLILGVVGVTFAFFVSNGDFENVFRTINHGVNIEEEFYDDWGTKKVSFVNNSTSSVVIRVSYNEIWSTLYDNDVITLLSNEVNDKEVAIKGWTENWLHDFTDGKDGWYYYNKVLKKNERVQVLNTIQYNEAAVDDTRLSDTYKEADYELDFNFESIQATERAIANLWGHTATIKKDGDIQWNF